MTQTKSESQIKPELEGIPETMLWCLHNRAVEAQMPNPLMQDSKSVEIHKSMDYDFERHFGKGTSSHAARSFVYDQWITEVLQETPESVIVNLGEGLETQRFRIKGPHALFLSVDVDSAIEARERFIKPDATHRHIRKSALDLSWFDDVPEAKQVVITAQGLFMYFEENQVAHLVQQIFKRFPKAILMFDYIPVSYSKKTMEGNQITPHYTTPKMPWGISRHHLRPTLEGWLGRKLEMRDTLYPFPRGYYYYYTRLIGYIPYFCNFNPGICQVRLC